MNRNNQNSDTLLRASRWTTVSSLSRAVFQVAQILVAARILGHHDFGVIALNSVVLTCSTLIIEFGISSAIIARPSVSPQERASLYWFTVFLALLMSVFLLLSREIIAKIFDAPDLAPLIAISAMTLIISASVEHLRAFAEKSFDFKRVGLIELSSGAIGLIVALVCLTSGVGAASIPIGAFAVSLAFAILAWCFLARGWAPEFRFSIREISWFFNFGARMFSNNIINQVSSTIDILIVGRVLGAVQLGLFSLPRNLILQVQSVINPIYTRIGLPLVAATGADATDTKIIYAKIMNLTASLNAPIYLSVLAYSPEVISLIFGEAWQHAVPVLQVLAVWGLLRSFLNPSGVLLYGTGRLLLALIWNCSSLVFVSFGIVSGANWGITGVAYALVATCLALLVPGWRFLVKPICGLTFRSYFVSIAVPTLAAAAAVAASYLATMSFDGDIARLAVGIPTGGIAYLLLSRFVNPFGFRGVVAIFQLREKI